VSDLDDHQLAAEIAQSTGDKLVDLLQNTPTSRRGWGGLEYEGDAMAHHHIVDCLRASRPDDAVLSEEGSDDRSRLGASRVWIVDPLDGSSDFGYSPHWAVHIALVIDGVPSVGAVSVPGWETTWATEPKPDPIVSKIGASPRIVVSRSRSHYDGRLLQDALNAEVMAVGSAGVKAMAVVRGDVDAYVHGGGLYEWDSCAPVAVARAAGLVCCRTDGAVLEFNKADPWSPGLVISRPELVDDIVAVMS
jgi:3'(2'), 5'-bisphosphate nucleotidase